MILLLLLIIIMPALGPRRSPSPSPSLDRDLFPGPETGTPNPPIKSLDFRGFDSSRLLILRGGNSHVR